MERDKLWDERSWFLCDQDHVSKTIFGHEEGELNPKMEDIYSSISDVDLQKLSEIFSTKTEDLSGLTSWLTAHGEKNEKGGPGIEE
jgi:hypothetical protein